MLLHVFERRRVSIFNLVLIENFEYFQNIHLFDALRLRNRMTTNVYFWTHTLYISALRSTCPDNTECGIFLKLMSFVSDRKVSGKCKDEQMVEKKQELEKRLQDVSGQLGAHKKQQAKKGKLFS